jgi:F-type H+-transporting ATPase subunit gamma
VSASTSLIGPGKDVRIIAVGRKARDQLRRLFGDKLIETFELSAHKVMGCPPPSRSPT